MPYRYRRRFRGYRRERLDPLDFSAGVLAIGFLLAVLASAGSFIVNALPLLIQLLLSLLVTALILSIFVFPLLLSRFLYRKSNADIHIGRVNAVALSPSKHGCRCYLDNLDKGEQMVADRLADSLDYRDYYIFNNIKLPNSVTGTSQIDHIVVSRFGVFLIETKSWVGLVRGHKWGKNWVRHKYDKSAQVLLNPIKQSYAHEQALLELVPVLKQKGVFKLIIFPYANLKIVRFDGVMNIEDGILFIQSHIKDVLTEDEVALIVGELALQCQTFNISNEQHVANLRSMRILNQS